MICDVCKRQMNYCFYINDEYWIKIVGKDKFRKNIGHVCAHCALQKVGGLNWYIINCEPLNKEILNVESCISDK